MVKPGEEKTASTLACRRWPGAASAYLIFKPEREALLVLPCVPAVQEPLAMKSISAEKTRPRQS